MRLETLSVFPEVFSPYLNASIMGRAQKANIFEFCAYDLRDWTHDRHRTVDDAPFGGGQGMLMKPAPIFEAVREISDQADARPHVVFFSPVGRPYSQAIAQEFAQKERILFVCGRYEGMDERVYELADDVISMGDSVVRLLPGALGDEMSSQDESFSDEGLLEYAQYTRPANFEGREVPSVLLSGDHGAVAVWRRRSALARTHAWRPDLLESAQLSDDDKAFLVELNQQSGDKDE